VTSSLFSGDYFTGTASARSNVSSSFGSFFTGDLSAGFSLVVVDFVDSVLSLVLVGFVDSSDF
jgi:hypothetical protein